MTIDIATRRVLIKPDTDPENPRDGDNVGRLVCWHDRYTLGDEQPDNDPREWLAEYAADLVGAEAIPADHVARILEKHAIIIPVYLYDHSGLAMSTGGFSCSWDSSYVGFIAVDAAKARTEWGDDWQDKAAQCLRAEVEIYSQYLEGDTYGFIIEEREVCPTCGAGDWETVDSCWGFYGSDIDTNGMADHLDDADAELARAADIRY